MKDIKNYEGLYAVTSCGKVWSYKYKKFLKPASDKKGYFKVVLYKNGKCKNYKIHRLVAEAYIPNPDNLPQVDHIDNDKTHNYINNLQWITNRNNVRKGRNKPILQYDLNGNYINEYKSFADAALELNCDYTLISYAVRKKSKAKSLM